MSSAQLSTDAATMAPGAAARRGWRSWYAAYFEARQAGSTQDEASEIAGRYMADVKQVFAR